LQARVHERRRAPWFSWVSVLLSAGVHMSTFAALGSVRIEPPPPRAKEVEFTIAEVEPAPPEPVAEPEPEKAPEPEPEPVKALKPKVAPPKPVATDDKPQPPPPAEETLADFSGTTLTSEGVGGWASAVGNNASMNGPIGKPNALVTGRDRSGVEGGAVGGNSLRVVGEDQLSRRPKMPNSDLINAALERYYPKSAKEQGIEGIARVKLRIMPNGSVQALATISESYAGFAEACKRAARETAWAPGLDDKGQPVATDVPFSCEFTLY
jgi:outer membrane biosynthesis protein TonB